MHINKVFMKISGRIICRQTVRKRLNAVDFRVRDQLDISSQILSKRDLFVGIYLKYQNF